jgi:hypothetical protein
MNKYQLKNEIVHAKPSEIDSINLVAVNDIKLFFLRHWQMKMPNRLECFSAPSTKPFQPSLSFPSKAFQTIPQFRLLANSQNIRPSVNFI